MDKNAIKKFAMGARRELIERVSQKAMQYGIEGDNIVDAEADSVGGKVLTDTQKSQRKALIAQINAKGYEEVMEEVAYTWFNRLIALRFMEVNGYLPTRVRVFTDEENNFKPQIIDEALHLDLDGLDADKVYEFKNANQTEELYKYLLITQCNALNSILPGMFQRISDYTELLLPDNLLREGSVIEQMISSIPEEDWKDAVQIIGWLYQYYNAEKKDQVFAALKKNIKITKENIPAATQLFTPDWIVRYMVENSLGRLWVEGHPNNDLKANWKYYLEEAEQEPEVQAQLAEIRKEYAAMTPEQIKCIDPCCGSGHILVYLFDVLMQIYESYGYTTREAVESIVQNNLYGLDIDDRAAQLAYFAVMMKARQYDRRFFSRHVQPHVYAIQNSKPMPAEAWGYLGEQQEIARRLWDAFAEAKEYGSLIKPDVTLEELEQLKERLLQMDDMAVYGNLITQVMTGTALDVLYPLMEQAQALVQKYDVVCTNPPYRALTDCSLKLNEYVKKNYPDSKSDLFAVFMEICGQMAKKNGYQAMITQHAWMFLSSFENLRIKVLQKDTINMAHLGARAFDEIGGEVVQTTSFVLRNSHMADYKGIYCRLIAPTTQQGKEDMYLAGENRYSTQQSNFFKIPRKRIGYWLSDILRSQFEKLPISFYADTRRGLQTGNAERFIRKWFEISSICADLSPTEASKNLPVKWFLFNNGGTFRRWYGNIVDVVNWKDNGKDIKNSGKAIIPSEDRYFDELISWNKISSGRMSVRYQPDGIIPGDASPFLHSLSQNHDIILYAMAILNSKIAAEIVKVLSPTLNFEVGNIAEFPLATDSRFQSRVLNYTNDCIEIAKFDWDSFEISWDFTKHPLIRPVSTLADAFAQWETECNDRFHQLKANEEELNRIFIDIYGLQDELTPEVEDKDVTVRKADLQRDIKSLISYAVGCMFGRYTIYADGLLYAGGPGWHFGCIVEKIQDRLRAQGKCIYPKNEFYPDEDNIIPICDDEYFTDDITGRFVKFIETVYGSETLEQNLKFIADALGGKGQPREVIRSYFLNDFYADHCKMYQKRPIYWLFDSGKKNGFKALIYMHRYRPDTIARIRTDYVHEQQSRYHTAIVDLEQRIASAATSERVKLNKALKKLTEQDAELRTYEEKIHHLADQMIAIDLDDGVKVNYAKFQDVLAKIK